MLVVYTFGGEVLLLKRLRPPVGIWQSVTGSLLQQEQAAVAARRELFEETGLQTEELPQATGITNRFQIVPEAGPLYAPGITENTERVFTLGLPDRAPVKLNKAEHSQYCWLPYEQAVEKVWSWTNKAAIRAVQQACNS